LRLRFHRVEKIEKQLLVEIFIVSRGLNSYMFKLTLTVLEACHRLALIEGQKENKNKKEEIK